jgi:hypothetical protein
MPTYDYRCAANGRVYEVNHPMAVTIRNWTELCAAGRLDPEDIPGETPVRKVISMTGGVIHSSTLSNPESPPCAAGGACPSGGCGY